MEDPRTRKRLNGERCGVARERISPVVPFEMARVGTDIIQLADLNFFLRPSRLPPTVYTYFPILHDTRSQTRLFTSV